jgi:hypothetical protein
MVLMSRDWLFTVARSGRASRGISETESASKPPCGFWSIDDQQLEI